VECKKEERTGGWGDLHHKELPSSYSSFSIRVTTLNSLRLGGTYSVHEDCKFVQNAYRKN